MLVDQQNSDVLPLLCEVLECLLDGGGLGLGVDHKEVALRVWGIGNMLDNRGSGQQLNHLDEVPSSHAIGPDNPKAVLYSHQRQQATVRSLS